jgi:pyruvate,water dikinase
LVDPDHWEIDRKSHNILSWAPGHRAEDTESKPLLNQDDLHSLLQLLTSVEEVYDWSPDIEWTGRQTSLCLLQARPITNSLSREIDAAQDERAWYLTLRPGDQRLSKLRKRVTLELIPELRSEGERLSEEQIEQYDDRKLARAIAKRNELVEKWRKIYREDFIPFAHGVRRLGIYYNDVICPKDPYEFVGLLVHQPMIASKRNRALREAARLLEGNEALLQQIRSMLDDNTIQLTHERVAALLADVPAAREFLSSIALLDREFLDIAYGDTRLCEDLRAIFHTLYELAKNNQDLSPIGDTKKAQKLEQLLLKAVGPQREQEARDIIETARLSWTLRDDDNLLLARIESQLLRAVALGAERLRAQKRLKGEVTIRDECISKIVQALKETSTNIVELEHEPDRDLKDQAARRVDPRQLVGQPASNGLATGYVRRIRGAEDLGKFCAGEVLVCDAIQPMMTHIVPLACGIVERRGGMLIHGAIIARELAIPCVNGVKNASELLEDGCLVTVDGNLGIVTVGGPEF